MALLKYDGFGAYATADLLSGPWGSKFEGGGSFAISAAAGRNSTNGLRLTSNGANSAGPWLFSSVGTASGATAIAGFALAVNSFSLTAGQVFSFLDGATQQVGLSLNSAGNLLVHRGGIAGTLLGTSASALTTGTNYYIEIKTVISASVGTVEVRVNGSSTGWINLTSQNTRNSGTAQWNGIAFGKSGSNVFGSSGVTFDYDDLYVCDGVDATATQGSAFNDFLGSVRAKVKRPSAPGNYTQFTPSTGANWQNVDDNPPDGDSTYNTASTAGLIDTYQYDALGLTGDVLAVQLLPYLRSAGGGAETRRSKIRIGSTDYNYTTAGVSTTYVIYPTIVGINPATGLPWTVAGVDGAEFGEELVS